MLKIAIIDDEPKSLQFNASLVELYTSDCSVLMTHSDPQEGLESILKNPPDLLLLDIEMPGMTGFELLKKVAILNFDVIFITAYNKYAIEAFQHHALDYLLKPVQPNLFVKAIEKAKVRKAQKSELKDLKALKDSLLNGVPSKEKQESRVSLSTMKSIEFVKLNQIIRIEAGGTYATFNLINNNNIVVSKNLGYYKDLENYNIMRCQKSHMVNLHHVIRYLNSDSSVEMTDHSIIPVSTSKKEELLRRLSNL